MAQDSKIQWTDHTFNMWRGCTKVAAGCANCYAETQSKRNPAVLGIWGDEGSRVVAAESQWKQVEKWETFARMSPELGRPRVFVASLADVFEDWDKPMVDSMGNQLWAHPAERLGSVGPWHSQQMNAEWIPLTMDDVRRRLFDLIDACPNLDFLLLTKRPENILRMWPVDYGSDIDQATGEAKRPHRKNCWLITSIANQEDADRNIPHLLSCRDLSPVLGVSAEPLVGPVDLMRLNVGDCPRRCALTGTYELDGYRPEGINPPSLDWAIVGGESGKDARPYNIEWVRAIIRQCKAAGVPCFHKQVGAVPREEDAVRRCYWPQGTRFQRAADGMEVVVKLTDPKGGDPSEWPEDLRVREFPR